MPSILSDLMIRLSTNSAELKTGLKNSQSDLQNFQKSANGFQSQVKGGFDQMGKSAGLFGESGKALMGSYSGAFGQLSNFVNVGIEGVKGMGKSFGGLRSAIVSTGIGALVIVIVAVFEKLSKAISMNSEVGDYFKRKWAEIKGVLSGIANFIIDKFVGAFDLVKGVLTGDWDLAAKGLKNVSGGFDGLGESIKNAVNKADKLTDLTEKIEKMGVEQGLKEQKLLTDIADLREKSVDIENYSAIQRKNFLNEAMTKQKELANVKKEMLNAELEKQQMIFDKYPKSREEAKKLNDIKVQILQADKEEDDTIRGMLRKAKTLNEDAKQELEYKQSRLNLEKELLNIKPLNKIDNKGVNYIEKKINRVETIYSRTGSIEPDIKGLQNFAKSVATSKYVLTDFFGKQKMMTIQSSFFWNSMQNSIVNCFDRMGDSLARGANSFKDFGKHMKAAAHDMIKTLIGLAVSHAIEAAFIGATKLGWLGLALVPAMAKLGAGLATTAFASLVPSFAEGGIIAGSPMLAMVGDSPRGPEVVSPLSDLKNMLFGNGGNNGNNGQVEFKIKGEYLVGVLDNHSRKINSWR